MCISNLEEYNNYTVLIRAVNGAGEGADAMITVRTLEAGLYISYSLNCVQFASVELKAVLLSGIRKQLRYNLDNDYILVIKTCSS